MDAASGRLGAVGGGAHPLIARLPAAGAMVLPPDVRLGYDPLPRPEPGVVLPGRVREAPPFMLSESATRSANVRAALHGANSPMPATRASYESGTPKCVSGAAGR